MAEDIIARLRDMATDHARYRTHYDGCAEYHLECAALNAVDEIELLRDKLDKCRNSLLDWR